MDRARILIHSKHTVHLPIRLLIPSTNLFGSFLLCVDFGWDECKSCLRWFFIKFFLFLFFIFLRFSYVQYACWLFVWIQDIIYTV